MSTLNHLLHLQEQVCYVQCGFCSTMLLVSVPCSSLSTVVSVKCGHCAGVLSVNMMKASFVPSHHLTSLTHLEPIEGSPEENADKTCSDSGEDDATPMNYVTNKRKRQRTPSAYNRFIKEEIRRLKAENPDMIHKEAFRTAAKNWANFPQAQFKGDEENFSQTDQVVDMDPTCGAT